MTENERIEIIQFVNKLIGDSANTEAKSDYMFKEYIKSKITAYYISTGKKIDNSLIDDAVNVCFAYYNGFVFEKKHLFLRFFLYIYIFRKKILFTTASVIFICITSFLYLRYTKNELIDKYAAFYKDWNSFTQIAANDINCDNLTVFKNICLNNIEDMYDAVNSVPRMQGISIYRGLSEVYIQGLQKQAMEAKIEINNIRQRFERYHNYEIVIHSDSFQDKVKKSVELKRYYDEFLLKTLQNDPQWKDSYKDMVNVYDNMDTDDEY